MCKIVNLKKEKYDVYIGRAGHGKDGYFGNPISLNKICPMCGNTHKENGSSLNCFKKYFYNRLNYDLEFKEKILNLKNKTLGCFCKPKPCHGDIIAEYVNKQII